MFGIVLLGVSADHPRLVVPRRSPGILLFGLIGIGSSIVDVSGLTLIQRAVPDQVLARVFGVIQMLMLSAMGLGAAAAPVLISLFGVEGAIIATGAFLPALVVLVGRRLRVSTPPQSDPIPTSCASSERCRSSLRCPESRSSSSLDASYHSVSSQIPS